MEGVEDCLDSRSDLFHEFWASFKTDTLYYSQHVHVQDGIQGGKWEIQVFEEPFSHK